MNILAKILNWVKIYQKELFLGSCIVLISIISYNLGQINALKKAPISITSGQADIFKSVGNKALSTPKTVRSTPAPVLDKRVVASKNSDKYHYTWCSGAKRIKTENQVWFASAQEAESRGYTLAGNCTPQ